MTNVADPKERYVKVIKDNVKFDHVVVIITEPIDVNKKVILKKVKFEACYIGKDY